MESVITNFKDLSASSKSVGRRLLTIGENRLELLMLELQEERERLLRAIIFALAAATFGLLAGFALSGVVVLLFWNSSPLAALVVLMAVYLAGAGFVLWRLMVLIKHWKNFPATMDQIKKDRICLEKILV